MSPTTTVPRSGRSVKAPVRRDRAFFSVTGKVAGVQRVVAGRRVLWKTVHPDRHRLTTPPAWACDEAVLDQAERVGATFVLLRERGTGRVWCAPVTAFRTRGLRLDRGHGAQVALPLARWVTGFDAERVLAEVDLQGAALRPAPAAPRPPKAGAEQQTLFPGAGAPA